MPNNTSSNIIKRHILFLLLFTSILSYCQEVNDVETPEKDVEVISFGDISKESERINLRIFDFRNILIPNAEVVKIDSILKSNQINIIEAKDSIITEIEDVSKRELKILRVDWIGRRSDMKSFQAKLNKRLKEITVINDELISENIKWEATKLAHSEVSDNKEISESFDGVISALDEIIKMTTERLENIYNVEKKLTELVLFTDEIIAELDNKEGELRKDYFTIDNNPIWQAQDSVLIETKILDNENISFNEKLISNKNQFVDFFKNDPKNSIFQLLFILFTFFVLTLVKRKWIIKLKDLTNPIEIQASIVLKHHIAATVVVGVLVSAFFYNELIPIVSEFFIFLLLCSTLILLPKLTDKRIIIFIICLFGVYLINLGESYIEHDLFTSRISLILESIVLIFGLNIGKKTVKRHPEVFTRFKKVLRITSPIYILFLIGAIFANIIGMVGLSRFLFSGVLSSSILLVIIYLSVKVITSVVVLIFKLRKSYGLHAVSTIIHATHKRIQPILFWTGILIWFIFSIKGFESLDYIIAWINELMELHWIVGKTTISLGGIISFTLIFTFTLLISKLAASIFEDEWMVNILPRGIAPAISLLLRIFLIVIGMYVGLTSAGVNLSELGFIVGALGVGIGFGLQNVVLNFIAGLILAFERPINIGDAIEIENEMGVVTSIGVRSSNIRSYGGYEAIIPNGDLISKKVINWTLTNRDRRSKKFFRTAPNVEPEKMIVMFNGIASKHAKTFNDPAPKTFFKGFDENGNLLFELWYWSTFSETLGIDHDIALEIFAKLKEEGIQAGVPTRKIIENN